MDEVGKENSKGALEGLKSKLYEKDAEFPERKRFQLHQRTDEDTDAWAESASEAEGFLIGRKIKTSFVKKFFFGSLIFFTLALGVSLFVFLGGTNVVSPENVHILVSAPVSVEAGEKLTFQIIIENKNNVPLEAADLLIEYPEGTQDPAQLEKPLQRVKRSLESVGAGETVTLTESAVLFGQEEEEKRIHITMEYRPRDSNAIFVAKKEYPIHINSSPLRLTVQMLREINSGKTFTMEVSVVSNTNQTLKNLLLHVEYPFGFSFVDATPKPVYGKNTWKIGDLPPGVTRKISIQGVIEGQDGEEKIFRVGSGIASTRDERTIGISYAALLEGVTIARPFLELQLVLDGELRKEHVVESEQKVEAEIVWKNNLPTKVVDAHIEARLKGPVLNQASVDAGGGFYRSFDNTIIWDSGTYGPLSEIESGGSGSVLFRFSSVPLFGAQGSVLRSPEVVIEVDVKAKRISETGVPQEVVSSASGVVKLNSDLGISQRSVWSSGPFKNTGSIPPQHGKETTYTIIWSVVNSSNLLSGGVAVARLPQYVRWMGNVSPESEEVIYNQDGRTVRWALGSVRAGTGTSLPPREVAFQVGFLPSISQLSESPALISDVEFSGVDQFTGREIKKISPSVTTELVTDPQYERGDGRVQ